METDREPFQHRKRESGDDPAAAAADRTDEGERSGYLGFVAHEVRNPLSTALWTAELLARMTPEERGGARGEKLSAMCLRSLSRMRLLIEDHFLCERLDSAGIAVRVEPIALAEVVEGVVEKRPVDAAPLTADRTLLERTLDSLFAVAGRDGTSVRVAAALGDDDTVAIEIRGQPPPADALEDPRKGSPSDPKGRALALAVARRAASALRGTLSLMPDGYALKLPGAKGRLSEP
jgi:signal transduction histidine kinase